MSLTKAGKALYMHCLPADISGVSCAQGEVSARSLNDTGSRPTVKRIQAFIISALIFLTRMGEPVKTLEKLVKRRAGRAL